MRRGFLLTVLLALAAALLPGSTGPAATQAQGNVTYRCTAREVALRECPQWGECGTSIVYDWGTILPVLDIVTGDREAGDDRWLLVEDPVQHVQGYVHMAHTEECELQPWQTLPIFPEVSDTTRAIYQRGLALGNDPHAFSKVGDCQNSEAYFLSHFDLPGQYNLGPYGNLQATIDQFSGSFDRVSASVKGGYTVASALSPLASDPAWCGATETPIMCEDRLHNPSIVLISMETWNRNGKRPVSEYEAYLDQVVKFWIERGVVPILATKADNIEGEHQINAAIARVAQQNGVPLWNWWFAAQSLDHHGFDMEINDRFHLSWARSFYNNPERLRDGWPVRNLTALEALGAVWRGVSNPAE